MNEALTVPGITDAIKEYLLATADDPPEPTIVHHPIDPELQPGESAKLGGAMEIRGPSKRD